MRLLFVSFGLIDSNSGIQAVNFGRQLTALGWDVTLACKGEPEQLAEAGGGLDCVGHDALPALAQEWRRSPEPSLVCAWTPRESVRRLTSRFIREAEVPYAVHLEDNEEYLLSSALETTISDLRRLPLEAQDDLADPDLVHPTRYVEFVREASGVTVVTEELNDFNPGRVPHRVVRIGTDIERFSPAIEPALGRDVLGIDDDDFVLVYNGTTHYANQHDMLSLYLAVQLLRRDGYAVRLVRTGSAVAGGVDPAVAEALADGVVELGLIADWRDIPRYLALADAFVQPGAPDEFNRYRLPSKLAEFLAMGRPVLLPRCNIGNELSDGENAILLEVGNALEIAERLKLLIADAELARRLAAGAREFARENLTWEANGRVLSDFYGELLGSRPAASTAGGGADGR